MKCNKNWKCVQTKVLDIKEYRYFDICVFEISRVDNTCSITCAGSQIYFLYSQ